MKIALVSPYDWAYPGGVKNHVTYLSREFTRMGHQTTIIAPSSKRGDELGTPNLMRIGKPIPFPIAGSIARVTLSFHRGTQIRDFLADEEFDVVHIHEPLIPVLPLWALRYSRTLNVGTFHAYLKRSRGYRAWRPIIKRWFRNLHGKIAVSKPAAELISKYYPGYYNIIPNGIDSDHFGADVPPIERFMDGKLNILFVGRMEKRKGLRYLLSAYSRLKWEYPQIRLIIVGPGQLDPASERVLGERVHECLAVVPPGVDGHEGVGGDGPCQLEIVDSAGERRGGQHEHGRYGEARSKRPSPVHPLSLLITRSPRARHGRILTTPKARCVPQSCYRHCDPDGK